MAWIIAHWWLFLLTSGACAAYINWKARGGNLLFRSKPTDDPTKKLFNGIFAFGFALGMITITFWIGIISAIFFIIAAVGMLIG